MSRPRASRMGPEPKPAEQLRSTRWYRRYRATGRCAEPLWQALRAASGPASVDELHEAIQAHPQQILNRLRRWQGCGFVAVAEPELPPRYRIAPEAAHLVEPPFAGSLAEAAWKAMVAIGRPATIEEIIAKSGAANRPLYCRLRRWVDQGFVERLERLPARYALAPEAPNQDAPPVVSEDGEPLPAKRSSRARMWQVMRILKRFDIPALQMTAEVSRRACDEFLNLLLRAGYAKISLRFHKVGDCAVQDWSQYRLVRDTGPRHPTFSKYRGKDAPRFLTDHNSGASVELAPRVPASARESNHVC